MHKAKLSRNPLFFCFLTLFFSLTSFTHYVYASGDVNITAIPDFMADKLGISSFSAGFLACSILLLAFLLPLAVFTRKRGLSQWFVLFIGLSVMSFGVAVGWIPVWTLTVVCILTALLLGNKFREMLG